MKIQTKATNITLTPEISAYLEKKLAALEKFVAGQEEVIIDVELGKTTNHHQTGDIFKAEFTLHQRGGTLRAVSETVDLYAAIDQAKDELADTLKTTKAKRRHLVRRGALKLKNMLKGLVGRGEQI